MKTSKPLPKTQQALLEKLKAGQAVHYLSGINACYFYSKPREPMKSCTAAAVALIQKGLAKHVDKSNSGAMLALTEAGEARASAEPQKEPAE